MSTTKQQFPPLNRGLPGMNGCMCTKFDIIFFSFIGLFVFVLGVVSVVLDESQIPDNLELLPVGDAVNLTVSARNSKFLEVEINNGDTVCYTTITDPDSDIDPTLTLLSKSEDLIQFNDDIAAENENSLLCHRGTSNSNLVLEVAASSEGGVIQVLSTLINEKLEENVVFETRLLVGEIYHVKLDLVEGFVYEVMAYSRTPVFDEFDSALRIKDFNGVELTEAFQSTLAEFTGRSIFIPPKSSEFLLEIREVAISNESNSIDVDLEVLLIRREVNELDINQNLNIPISSAVTELKSTLYGFTFPAESIITFQFDFDAEAIANLEQDINRMFGEPGKEMLSSVIPGLSMRVYDKDSNFVIARSRSELETDFDLAQEYTVDEALDRNFVLGEFFHVETILIVETNELEKNVILDITRWHPNFNIIDAEEFENSPVLFDFDFTISIEENPNVQVGLVDQFDLFPDCDIDPGKLTLGDGTCDQGIVLFCRNDIFPGNDTTFATVQEFSDICTCAVTLCEALISGADISNGLITFFTITDFVFIICSFIPIFIYCGAIFDLFYFGGFNLWLETTDVFKTFTLCIVFFISAIVFYSTKFAIDRYTNEIVSLDDNFDESIIQNPADALTYSYYDNAFDLRNEFLEDDVNIEIVDVPILDPAIVPDVTFAQLQNLINANGITEGLLLFFAIIVFVDVSLVWIKSVKSMSLNREVQKRRVKVFTRVVLGVEVAMLFLVLLLCILIIQDEGEAFVIFAAYFTLLVSLAVAVTYLTARLRLNFYFNILRLESDDREYEIWKRIKFTSTVVIGALAANMVVEFYVIVTINDVEDAIESENSIFALNMFLFQDIAMFLGQLAIFYYLFKSYLKFRDSLFVTSVVQPADDIEDTENEITAKQTEMTAGHMQSNDSVKSISQTL